MSTLKVDTILKRTGTGTITVGQSGDTIAMPSATLTTALPVASGGTGGTSFSAAGLANTPAFHAYQVSSGTSVSHNTWTSFTNLVEQVDTDSAFASNSFTVPSGKTGSYLIAMGTGWVVNADDKLFQWRVRRTNSGGSTDTVLLGSYQTGDMGTLQIIVQSSRYAYLTAGDVLVPQTWQQSGGTLTTQHSNDYEIGGATYFSGFKLVGA